MHAQDYQPLVKREEALAAVEKNLSGSKPKELFEDALEAADAQFDKDRAALKAAVKEKEIAVGLESTFEEFCAALEGAEGVADIIRPNKCAFYLHPV
jgi:pre-mRNA-processing factor 40